MGAGFPNPGPWGFKETLDACLSGHPQDTLVTVSRVVNLKGWIANAAQAILPRPSASSAGSAADPQPRQSSPGLNFPPARVPCSHFFTLIQEKIRFSLREK
jgi:hypothetical protein